MSTPVHVPISNIIDRETGVKVARQLLDFRRRLGRRLKREPPRISDLSIALQEYIATEDDRRAHLPTGLAELATPSASDAATIQSAPLNASLIAHLYHCLQLSNLAYETERKKLDDCLRELNYELLHLRLKAGRFAPSYFVAFCKHTSTLSLVIRGTYEAVDVLTDIATDTEPFLGVRAHTGITRSAFTLQEEICPSLAVQAAELRPARVLLTGHSLGASVASALTMLLRSEKTPSTLSDAECVAFCPPAFLTDANAAANAEGIVAIVHGMDIIPRLSFSALDRLSFRLANVEVKDDRRSNIQRAVENMLVNGFESAALAMSTSLVGQTGGLSSIPDMDVTSVEMQEEEVDELEELEQTYLAGRILYVERMFSEERRCSTHFGLCAKLIRETTAMEFVDIEASAFMIDDHFADKLLLKFKEIMDSAAQSCS